MDGRAGAALQYHKTTVEIHFTLTYLSLTDSKINEKKDKKWLYFNNILKFQTDGPWDHGTDRPADRHNNV